MSTRTSSSTAPTEIAAPSQGGPTFFFVHVMKTGGTTFNQHVKANFPHEAQYPRATAHLERQREYYMIDELRRLTPEQRAATRIYYGHFPFVMAGIMGADVTLTILRDPVERTVSYLRHRKRWHDAQRDLALEEIYEDSWVHPLYIRNYQSKLFAMTEHDKLESHLDVIEIDEARLRTAMANLERVDVLGLQDSFDRFVAEMRDRFGWQIKDSPNKRVSTEDWDVSAAFRRRIAEDNRADVEFFERAQELHRQRA